jgi:hypothetical protein
MGADEVAAQLLASEGLVEVALARGGLPADALGGVVVEHHPAVECHAAGEAVGRAPQVDQVDDIGQRSAQAPVVDRLVGPDRQVDIGCRSGPTLGVAAEQQREAHAMAPQDRAHLGQVDRQLHTPTG